MARMTARIDSPTLKAWLSDTRELALLDVREPGQFGEGHLFFAVPLPYSRFEPGLPALVPTPQAWLTDYLERTCAGGRAEHLGRHPAFDVEGRPADRNLFAVLRRSADTSPIS